MGERGADQDHHAPDGHGRLNSWGPSRVVPLRLEHGGLERGEADAVEGRVRDAPRSARHNADRLSRQRVGGGAKQGGGGWSRNCPAAGGESDGATVQCGGVAVGSGREA